MDVKRIGSLCSGYGGLDLGLASVIGGETAWLCEYDKHPSTILAQRFPGVPNYGDITTTDWSQVEPVDWITAGYPCQPFSHAGKRQGTNDERHIWPDVWNAVRLVRPQRVLLENVAGHLSLGFGDVLGDLARLGYDARWGVLRAADVGAPHGRKRVFIVATDTQDHGREHGVTRRREQELTKATGNRHVATDTCRGPLAGAAATGHGLSVVAERGGQPAPDASGERHGRGQDSRGLGRLDAEDAGSPRQRERAREESEHRGGEAAPDAEFTGTGVHGTDGGRLGESSGSRRSTCVSPRDGTTDSDRVASGGRPIEWGTYGPAITRWEAILGRRAPAPTEPGRNGPRLAPAFVEFLMGLPAGWVTDVDITRNAQLKALGNGVVPQQAAAAVRWLTAEAVAA